MQWEWKQSTPLVYLEAAHVVVFAAGSSDGLERAHLRPPRVVRDAEVHERPHQVRPEKTQLPRHDGAPVVPHHEHLQREDNPIKKKTKKRSQGRSFVQRIERIAAVKPGAGRVRR